MTGQSVYIIITLVVGQERQEIHRQAVRFPGLFPGLLWPSGSQRLSRNGFLFRRESRLV
jgi:hypothetical protein